MMPVCPHNTPDDLGNIVIEDYNLIKKHAVKGSHFLA
jgi:hypothetical protein